MRIDQLREYITHFSAQLPHQTHSKDEVVVGGRIKSCQQYTDEHTILILDDYVGEVNVILFNSLYQHYENILQPNQFVLVKGIVNVVEKKINHIHEKHYSVVGYNLAELKEACSA